MVCQKFFADLKDQLKNHDNPFLIFSGDLVSAGAEADFYREFESKFGHALAAAGIPRERRICIPGNHDVSRAALKTHSTLQKGSLAQINDEQTFNNNLSQLSEHFFKKNFENYCTWESRFAHYTACSGGLGGSGWSLSDEIGVYCLNTALCSFAGLEEIGGKPISDQGLLMVDTRSLYKWLTESGHKLRILVMHHPIEWLSSWARAELEKIIRDNFKLVFSGHVHQNDAVHSTQGREGHLHVTAPPLFTDKTGRLGYAIVTLNSNDGSASVRYRAWCAANKFVLGTSLSSNETGVLQFNCFDKVAPLLEFSIEAPQPAKTIEILQAEFDEARICYSSKKLLWVERDLANVPETSPDAGTALLITSGEFARSPHSCAIRCPKQFGLSCLGTYLALEHHRHNSGRANLIVLDAISLPHHRSGIREKVLERCTKLRITVGSVHGFIIDGWTSDKGTRRLLRELRAEFSHAHIIILAGEEDFTQMDAAMELGEELATIKTYFLWSLSRARIRSLASSYVQGNDSLDDDVVTRKVTDDIDALNIHRTPLNCLLLLKLAEQQFDESPVNRTEMIGRVLWLLFYQFDKIPRYATRPDLKDCEFALGFFCESLIRSRKNTFTKNEFYAAIQQYCASQLLDLDIEVLFAFLVSENILVRRGLEFGFRFIYWLYYFAAHRMHHSPEFAQFILAERKYSAFPEIMEFYAGIDRMRADAVDRLAKDLDEMDADFLQRSGIPTEYSPFAHIRWATTAEAVEKVKQQLAESIAESALPAEVKDAIADRRYNRARPYAQTLARFIDESSLAQMVAAMRGASRVLRNSDHVSPEAKARLLDSVLRCWVRVCQTLVVISPLLAEHKRAFFEGVNFCLDSSFDKLELADQRWKALVTSIVDNVVDWYHHEMFSKKLGALFVHHVTSNKDTLSELLIVLTLVKQRPHNWEREVENYILRQHKNSFALSKVFALLRHEFRIAFATERTRHQLRRLAGMAVAKHGGAKHPNSRLIERAAQANVDTPPDK